MFVFPKDSVGSDLLLSVAELWPLNYQMSAIEIVTIYLSLVL